MICKHFVTLFAAYLLSSCGSSVTPKTQGEIEAEKNLEESMAFDAKSGPKKPIDGFQDIKLGQSFEDVIGTVDGDQFNPVSLQKCYDELPLRGCSLYARREGVFYVMTNGIRYGLSLTFNRNDKLTDLRLAYEKRNNITHKECLRIMARTLDWLEDDYGALSARKTFKDQNKMVRQVSPDGNAFEISPPISEGYVSSDHVSNLNKWQTRSVTGGEKMTSPIRYLSLMSSYIVIPNEVVCSVDATFSEPQSVERPD